MLVNVYQFLGSFLNFSILRKLQDTAGKCAVPKIGWQIDPFGHSREHASLVKQLGFEGLVIVRIDYRDKERRRADRSLDFLWESNPNFEDSQIFTTMFPDFYFEENGFCFDVMCWDTITDYNVKTKVDSYAKILDRYKEYYKTNNIMMPMGRDFTYQKADQNYDSLDKFIDGFKDHPTYNVIYSTPSCYIQAVKDSVTKNNIELEVKSDDFFPYASEPHSFWTGYFTSRPTSKRLERMGNNILQSAKQLVSLAKLNNQSYEHSLEDLRGAMGVMQHHDGITGTEKQAVSDDYASMLHAAIRKAEKPVGIIIGNLLKKTDDVDLKLSSCLLTNVSICDTTQKDKFLVVIHNPLSRVVTHYVHLPVEGNSYKITGPDGEEVYDIFDTIHSFDYITATVATKELVFAARDLPPLGIKVYYVETTGASDEYKPFQELDDDDGTFGTESNGFVVDPKSGKLVSVTINGVTQQITQEFLYYAGYTDGTSGDHRSSGAYIFRPDSSTAVPMSDAVKSIKCIKGNLVDQCLQVISGEVSQLVKVYKRQEDAYVEFDWLVGDLQFVDNKGKEVITRFTVSDFSNNNTFYTDANGRQLIQRVLNTRSDFDFDPELEPVSGNYYPVTSKIVIKDETENLQVAVLNDRAQGGSSLQEGSLELMVHRRLRADDGYGVTEALNEVQYGKGLYVRGSHYLTFGSSKPENSSSAFERELAHRVLLQPRVFLTDATTSEFSTLAKVQELIAFKYSGLKTAIPENLHILTFEPWKDGYLLRLEHTLEKSEDAVLSKAATLNLTKIFASFSIIEISELKLGANQGLQETEVAPIWTAEDSEDFEVTLDPMEIRTFFVKTDRNNSSNDNDDNDGDDDDGDDNNGGKNNNGSFAVSSPLLTILFVALYTLLKELY